MQILQKKFKQHGFFFAMHCIQHGVISAPQRFFFEGAKGHFDACGLAANYPRGRQLRREGGRMAYPNNDNMLPHFK